MATGILLVIVGVFLVLRTVRSDGPSLPDVILGGS